MIFFKIAVGPEWHETVRVVGKRSPIMRTDLISFPHYLCSYILHQYHEAFKFELKCMCIVWCILTGCENTEEKKRDILNLKL